MEFSSFRSKSASWVSILGDAKTRLGRVCLWRLVRIDLADLADLVVIDAMTTDCSPVKQFECRCVDEAEWISW
jgi:hypothetical protein